MTPNDYPGILLCLAQALQNASEAHTCFVKASAANTPHVTLLSIQENLRLVENYSIAARAKIDRALGLTVAKTTPIIDPSIKHVEKYGPKNAED